MGSISSKSSARICRTTLDLGFLQRLCCSTYTFFLLIFNSLTHWPKRKFALNATSTNRLNKFCIPFSDNSFEEYRNITMECFSSWCPPWQNVNIAKDNETWYWIRSIEHLGLAALVHVMMTSSNGLRWIPLTNASDAELRCFLWSAPEYTVE